MGGGSGAGYSVEETRTELFTETATGSPNHGLYMAMLQAEAFDADSVVVTFNGTEYACEKFTDRDKWGYGENPYTAQTPDEIDFSEFPFSLIVRADAPVHLITLTPGSITPTPGSNTTVYLITPTPGPNTIKVETISETVTPTDEFKAAVKSVIDKIISDRLLPEYANQPAGATLQLREKTDGTGEKEPYWYSRLA
jgi:hypothetical protein